MGFVRLSPRAEFKRVSMTVLCVLATVPAVACGPVNAAPTPLMIVSKERNVLTRTDIERANSGSAFDLIRTMRSDLLVSPRVSNVATPADAAPRIYIDQIPFPFTLDDLRAISASSVVEVRYLSAMDATTRYGSGHRAGVIHITTVASRPESRP
jgi:hypothetical protein